MYRIGRLRRFGVGLVGVLACFFAGTVAKAVTSVALEWNPNTDPSVAGYNVYYGGTSHTYTNRFDAGILPSAEIGGLLEGKTYYFAVTAYDDFGDESDFSVETIYIVPGYLTLTPGASPGDPMQVRFPVSPSRSYELQMSQDLQNWTTIWQVVGTTNTWMEYDAPIGNFSSQFFRVVLH